MSETCFFNEDQPSVGMICVIYGSNNAEVQLNHLFLHEDALQFVNGYTIVVSERLIFKGSAMITF